MVFTDDIENGDNGWTHDAPVGTDSWAITGTHPFDGANAWQVMAPADVGDQRLTSPVVALPDDLSGLTLQFEHFRDRIEGSGSACLDGGILEVSIDGGVFGEVPSAQLITGPYTSTVASSGGNPLAGNPAWCGPGADYEPVVADLSAYAGHDVQFRFRFGSDNTLRHEGNWYIDAVKVQGCSDAPGDRIFADGFEGTP
jgi:hypothetical protein